MTVPDQYGKAEEFAAEAVKYLGQAGGKAPPPLGRLAQVYATLAVAAAIEAAAMSRGRPQIPGPGIVPPVLPEPLPALPASTRASGF